MSATPNPAILASQPTNPVDFNPGIGSFGTAMNSPGTSHTPETPVTPPAHSWGGVSDVQKQVLQPVLARGLEESDEEPEKSEPEPESDDEDALVAKLAALRAKKAVPKKSASYDMVKVSNGGGLIPSQRSRDAAVASFAGFVSPVGGPSGSCGQVHYYTAPVTYNITNHYGK